jgi:hypothetical protein
MNNEPIAWIACLDCGKRVTGDSIHTCSPQLKTLTDFEIKGVLALDECWIGEDSSMPNMIAFARAILKKAQEK